MDGCLVYYMRDDGVANPADWLMWIEVEIPLQWVANKKKVIVAQVIHGWNNPLDPAKNLLPFQVKTEVRAEDDLTNLKARMRIPAVLGKESVFHLVLYIDGHFVVLQPMITFQRADQLLSCICKI